MTRARILWASVCCAALGLSGCLAPQDIHEAKPAPTVRNNPPRIVPDTVLVDNVAQTKYVTQSGCSPRLDVGVIQDFDAQDDLEIRWFLNYDDGGAQVFPIRIAHTQGGQDVRDGVRRIPGDSLDLDLDRHGGRTVVIEALVSDGFDDPIIYPTYRRVLPGRDYDVATWVLEVQDDRTCLPYVSVSSSGLASETR